MSQLKEALIRFVPTLITMAFISYVAYLHGNSEGYTEGLNQGSAEYQKDQEDRCYCGQTRACPFGGGIVGIQKCDPVRYHWMRCEPNTEYCTGTCLDMLKEAEARKTK